VNDLTTSADSLLREIATELVKLPLDGRSRPLHLKALALKQVVLRWSGSPPPGEFDAMLDELRLLQAQVLEIRRTSGVRLHPTRPAPRRMFKAG